MVEKTEMNSERLNQDCKVTSVNDNWEVLSGDKAQVSEESDLIEINETCGTTKDSSILQAEIMTKIVSDKEIEGHDCTAIEHKISEHTKEELFDQTNDKNHSYAVNVVPDVVPFTEIDNMTSGKTIDLGSLGSKMDIDEDTDMMSIDSFSFGGSESGGEFEEIKGEEKNYRLSKSSDLNLVLKNIESGEPMLEQVTGRDCVLIIGKTGTGKSSLIQALAGKKFAETEYKSFNNHDISDVVKKVVYEAVDPLPGFHIGHEKKSKTSTIECYDPNDDGIYAKKGLKTMFVDSPGFDDTRGHEVDIATSVLLTQVAIRCRTIRFVVMISFVSILENRGDSMRSILRLIRFFTKNFEEEKQSFMFLFTHSNEIKGVPDNVDGAKKCLREEIIRTIEGTTDEETKSVLNHIQYCLKKNYPFVNVFLPLQTNGLQLGESIQKYLKATKDPHIARKCALTSPSLSSLCGQLQHSLIKFRRDLSADSLQIDAIFSSYKLFKVLGDYIYVNDVKKAKDEAEFLLQRFVQNQIIEIEKGMEKLSNADKDFGIADTFIIQKSFSTLKTLEENYPNLVNCKEIEVKMNEKLNSFYETLCIGLGQSFTGLHKHLSKLMVWSQLFPDHSRYYTDAKIHLTILLDEYTNKSYIEKGDADALLEEGEMQAIFQALYVLNSIENEKELLAYHGFDTQRTSNVYQSILNSIKSVTQIWLDRVKFELKDEILDDNKIRILSKVSLRFDEMIHFSYQYHACQDLVQWLLDSRTLIASDVTIFFENIVSGLETLPFDSNILKSITLHTKLAADLFLNISDGMFRRIMVVHERLVEKIRSDLMKLVGQIEQVSGDIKKIGITNGIKCAELLCAFKAMGWFDEMLSPNAFIRNVSTSFERVVSDRVAYLSQEIVVVIEKIESDTSDTKIHCKALETLLLESEQISLFSNHVGTDEYASLKTLAREKLQKCVSSFVDQKENYVQDWTKILTCNVETDLALEKIDSMSEEIEFTLRKIDCLSGLDSHSDHKLNSIKNLMKGSFFDISQCMRSTMEANKAYKEKLRFLKILRMMGNYSNIKKGLPDLQELQTSARNSVAFEARQIEDLLSQTSEWDRIDTVLSQFEEAKILDEFIQNEASSRTSPLVKLRNQKQEEVNRLLDEFISNEDFKGIGEFLIPYAESKDQIMVTKFNKWLEKISSAICGIIGSILRSLDGNITTEGCDNITRGLRQLESAQKQLKDYLADLSGGLDVTKELGEIKKKLNDKFHSLLLEFDTATKKHDYERMGICYFFFKIYVHSSIMEFITQGDHDNLKTYELNYKSALEDVPTAMSKYVTSNFVEGNDELFYMLQTLRSASQFDSPPLTDLRKLYTDTQKTLAIKLNCLVEELCDSLSKTECYDDAIELIGLLNKHLNHMLVDHVNDSDLTFKSGDLLKEWKDLNQSKDPETEFDLTKREEEIVHWKARLNKLHPSNNSMFSWNTGRTYKKKQSEIGRIINNSSKRGHKSLKDGDHTLLEDCIIILDLAKLHLKSHLPQCEKLSENLQNKAKTEFLNLCKTSHELLQSDKYLQFRGSFSDYRGFVVHVKCVLMNDECKKEYSLTNQLVHEKVTVNREEIIKMFDNREFDKIHGMVVRARDFGDFVADNFTLLKEELSHCGHMQKQDIWLDKIHNECCEHFSNGRIFSSLKDFATLELTPSTGKAGVHKAYRRLSRKYHPDKNSSADAKQLFQTLTEAKNRLIKAVDSKKKSEPPFGSLVRGLGSSLRRQVKCMMDEQRYEEVENILFAMKDLKSLRSLVTPHLDETEIINDVHSLVKSYVLQAKTSVSTSWSEKKYKLLNENISDLRMMEERFKAYANIFPSSWNDGIVEKVEEEIVNLAGQAREYISSKESAKRHRDDFKRCFLQMGHILLELPLFKNFTKDEMCNVLEACLNFDGGYSFLFEFALSLRKSDDSDTEEDIHVAQVLLSEFNQFKEVMTMVWNEETSQKPAEDTVKGIHGTSHVRNIKSELSLDRDLLLENFYIFEAEYKTLLGEYISPEAELKTLVLKLEKLAKELQPIHIKHDWNENLKGQIPHMLAGIFTVFTVLKSGESYNRIITSNGNGDKLLMKPHNIQVLTLLSLFGCGSSLSTELSSQLIQIRTGEGKSMILGAASVLLALLGFSVQCVCYSDYLSTRDYNLFQDIFNMFSVTDCVKYSKITTLSEKTTLAKGDIRHLTDAMLRGNLTKGENNIGSSTVSSSRSSIDYKNVHTRHILKEDSHPKRRRDKRDKRRNYNLVSIKKTNDEFPKQEILLVDEVDVFFGGDFYGQTYNQVTQFRDPEIESILKHIWIANKRSNRRQRLADIKALSSYKRLMKKMQGFQFLIDAEISIMIDQVRKVDEEPYYLDREGNRIGYKVMDSISYDVTYGYRTVFAYLKEADMKNLKNEEETLGRELCMPISCGQFSYAKIAPHCILGVSGTLSALGNFEYDVLSKYGVETYLYVPSVYGKSNFHFDKIGGISIDSIPSDYFYSITRQIKELTAQKRSVIVFFENNSRLQEFVKSPFYGKLGRQKKILTESLSQAEKEFVISKAATARQITLSTAVFGRGTDFFCKDESVISNGGVHVIQTFLSEELSEEIQIQGRTARQGKRGSYEMILLASDLSEKYNLSDDFKDNVTKTQWYEELCKARERLQTKHHSIIQKNLIDATSKDDSTHKYFNSLLREDCDEAAKRFQDIYTNFKKAQMPSSIQLDIGLLIDTTGSMAPYMKSIVKTISVILNGHNSIMKKLKSKFPDIGFSLRVGLLSYRDIDDDQQFIESAFSNGCHFTDDMDKAISELQVSTQSPSGGGDLAEDHLGAINKCLKWNSWDDWTAQIKFMLLFTDAPSHGMVSRGSIGKSNVDNYPTRHPLGITGKSVVKSLVENEVDLFFCSFNPSATSVTEEKLSTLFQKHPNNTEQRGIVSIPMVPKNRSIVLSGRTTKSNLCGEHGKHIVFVLDMSGSMCHDWSGVEVAYNEYIARRKQNQSHSDLVSVVQFDDDASTTVRMVPLNDTPNSLHYSGGETNFYPAAEKAFKNVSKTPSTHTPTVVFMSDGQANDASAAARIFSELNCDVRQKTGNDLELHVIAFGSNASTSQLQEIANSSGAGKLYTSADTIQLSNIFVDIATNGDVAEVLEAEIGKRISEAVSDKLSLEYVC